MIMLQQTFGTNKILDIKPPSCQLTPTQAKKKRQDVRRRNLFSICKFVFTISIKIKNTNLLDFFVLLFLLFLLLFLCLGSCLVIHQWLILIFQKGKIDFSVALLIFFAAACHLLVVILTVHLSLISCCSQAWSLFHWISAKQPWWKRFRFHGVRLLQLSSV